ncbi:MAG: hypothetical protein U5O69_02330 [Candidatus Competibacteraceae bacterium]|nr:hypothetical protein [Candidatus Competibacteraceae bacterium]
MITSAHIIGGRSLGGAELFYARLVSALHRRGHATLAITVPNSLIANELSPDLPQIHIAMRGIWDWWARWQIQKTLRQHHPDIVQTYMGRATRLTRLRSDPATDPYSPLGRLLCNQWLPTRACLDRG